MFAKFLKDESGATAIEYTLLAALIGVAGIAAMQGVGTEITGTLTEVETALQGAEVAGGEGGGGEAPAGGGEAPE
ncbi:MAG: Flp family type IVb pilin [Pseudomonadota bacterium]